MPQIYKREEVDPDRYTMAGWIGKSTALLEPLAYAIKKHVLKGEATFADDTPVKMLALGSYKTRVARLWAYVRDERPWTGEAYPATWYQFSLDRKGVRPREHLADYEVLKKCIQKSLRIKGQLSECGNDFFNFNGV